MFIKFLNKLFEIRTILNDTFNNENANNKLKLEPNSPLQKIKENLNKIYNKCTIEIGKDINKRKFNIFIIKGYVKIRIFYNGEHFEYKLESTENSISEKETLKNLYHDLSIEKEQKLTYVIENIVIHPGKCMPDKSTLDIITRCCEPLSSKIGCFSDECATKVEEHKDLNGSYTCKIPSAKLNDMNTNSFKSFKSSKPLILNLTERRSTLLKPKPNSSIRTRRTNESEV
jgi:hypothetical protein